MIKAIIFDMDGVLVDSASIMKDIYIKAFEGYPVKIDDSITKYMGIGSYKIIEIYCKKFNIPYSQELASKIDEKKQKDNIAVIDKIKVLPGVHELLDYSYKKFKLVIASSNAQNVIKAFIEKKQLKKYFNAFVSREDVDIAKPNPDIFLKAAEKLNINPKECLVIEDSVFGIEAAKNAGMRCIGVTTGVYDEESLKKSGADIVLSSLKEINKIKDFLNKCDITH